MLVFTAKTLLTPLEQIERPLVLIDEGRVATLSAQSQMEIPAGAERVDFGEHILVPGFVDIHVHGSAGYDVMEDDEQGRRKFEEFLAHRGVTSYYPTTVTASLDTILRAVERLATAVEAAQRASTPRAQALGIHLEGPFLSHIRRGVHPPENLLAPDVRTFEKLWQASRGHIRLMTMAPELPGAAELISAATQRGVCVSLGHSDATLEQTRDAISAGARHATHTFNAMRPLDHRNPGILGEVLTNAALTADLIADGVHVHPNIVRLFLEAKGVHRAVLITDATAAAGMPDGRYRLGSFEVDVHDGKCLHDGKLAGSVLTLNRAIQNVMSFAGLELKDAVRLATLNPAKVAGAERKGTIAVGSDADFAVLNSSGEVQASIVKGTRVQQ